MTDPTPGSPDLSRDLPGVRPTPETIALQLYTLRQETAQDFLGALQRVAAFGYRAVEFAGYGAVSVPDLRAALDEYGLRAVAAHVPLPAWETRLDDALAELRQLGCAYAVVPFVPEERRQRVDQARSLAADLNHYGAACRDRGLAFAYHNHAFEFAPLPDGATGQSLFDVLVAETDPSLVAFELDAFWVAVAGLDPVALLRRHAGRVPLLHLKDLAPNPAPGEQPSDAPVGDGTLPWPEIFTAAAAAGTRWYIVEQDHPRDAFVDVERSLRNLERMRP